LAACGDPHASYGDSNGLGCSMSYFSTIRPI
jgi:hypothetical protein